MQKKIEEHIFQGMQRDMSISKQKAEFLWDAHNIRLTSRHGETLLSLTNERGTKKYNNTSFIGVVLGYCVLGKYLTVFTKDINATRNPDYIYRVEKLKNRFNMIVLYNGNLNFNVDYPIECLGVYENVDIQKVYWTDGINQPRVINITKDIVDGSYIDTSFDFIPTLSLKDSIHVRKVPDSSGLFPAGVIQYAVTYYNKYGQESNVSVISPLIPTSYTSRAGSPEETIGNAFKVTIKNPDTQFEFLRLYSIFRSSKNTTPVCKRVADVRLSYGNKTSRVLHTSDDKHNSAYEKTRLEKIWFKENSSEDFVALQGNTSHLGNETITINGEEFESGTYFYFSKEDYPELILKAQIYNYDTEELEESPTYLTWGTNTHILICNTLDGSSSNSGIYDIWPVESGLLIAASNMYYNSIEFVSGDEVTITDNNTIGEDVDYNELLFVGGEEITAGTITLKDGTMFLGDITISRPQITGDYSDIAEYVLPETIVDSDVNPVNMVQAIRKGTTVNCSNRTCYIPLTMNSSSYKWGNTLNAHMNNINGESTNIAGFKWGEHYRLGLQFQYKTGKWSQPVFIEDYTIGDPNITDNNVQKPSLNIENGHYKQTIPTFTATLDSRVGSYMLSKNYLRVRPVVCFPTESDQLILCQGLINPTVHSIAGRLNHTPDILSSWYFRPVPKDSEEPSLKLEAGLPQHKDGYTLYSGESYTNTGNQRMYQRPTRNDEILGVPLAFSGILYSDLLNNWPTVNISNPIYQDSESDFSELRFDNTTYDAADLTNVFIVDWEYLTFHSPDFEFNDAFRNIDTSTLKCQIIGKQLLESNHGDVHIMTSSTTISTNAPGFYHRVVLTGNSAYRINAGLFYKDSLVNYDDGKYKPVTGTNDADITHGFLVYPWHRTGSLNNDCVRPHDKGNRSAMLSLKKISNVMYFNEMLSYTKLLTTEIQIFNSDLVSLTKINNNNYFGNIDLVITSRFKYLLGITKSDKYTEDFEYISSCGTTPINVGDDSTDTYPWSTAESEKKGLILSNDPIYMKYKSTPHAVIHTNTILSLSEDTVYNEGEDNEYTLPKGDFPREEYPYLFCAEMYRDENENTDFGGKTPMAILNNIWYPAGPAVSISSSNATKIQYMYGDTYFQRYDCLKTYPFTDEDTNSIIEIGSFMVETRINMDGRYDKSRGDISNFMLNPTVFNKINLVYSQMDNFFNYRILDEDYYALSKYPTMVTWTGYKNNAAEIDNWTNITLASTLEMDGTKGKVNAVRVNSDQLYCFQDDAIGQILFNSRVQISPSDGVPIEISNNYKVDGNRYISTTIGCKNKWTIAEGADGLYFIDDNTKALYQLGGQLQLKPISTPLNMSYWFINQDSATLWRQHYWGSKEYSQQGIRCFYDNANADLYICTPDGALCYCEKLGQFVSFFDYHNVIGMFNIDSDYYALNYPDGDSSSIMLWGMFQGQYNTIFNKMYQSDFTFISNENPLNDKIFTNIDLRGDFRFWNNNNVESNFYSEDHIVDHNKMFDTIRVWNEYQDTTDRSLKYTRDLISNMKKKFRIWRIDIPRDNKDKRQRIRNTWSKIKFTMNTMYSIPLADMCGRKVVEFMTRDNANDTWVDLDFSSNNFKYDSENDRIVETIKSHIPTISDQHNYYYYDESGTIIMRKPDNGTAEPHAYRKIHDMEIHDIGVVYFV